MKGKRTSIDFSNHEHRIEIFKSGEKEIRVDHFQVGNSSTNYIQFINTDRVMTVTGDFGNWIFCRPFHPSPKGGVSEQYWIEKLRISSSQELARYDADETEKEIKELIKNGLEEYGYKDDELKEIKDWFKELLQEVDDELNYTYKAFREYGRPNFIDGEQIPLCKKVNQWLLIIFDAFDEICRRLELAETSNSFEKTAV
jgi:hypothetical protein